MKNAKKQKKTEQERLDISKIIADIKGVFHARMGMIKGRNNKDLTEAEEIKKWQEYTKELYESLKHPDNYDGVVTHLEPDILECEVKWAFSSVQVSSATQSCPTLCDPMNHSMPGLPVHHHLPEFTQTHIH